MNLLKLIFISWMAVLNTYAQAFQPDHNCPIINGTFTRCYILDDQLSIQAELNCPAYRTYHFIQEGWKLKTFVQEYGLDSLRHRERLSVRVYSSMEEVIHYAQTRFADQKYQECLQRNALPDIKASLMQNIEKKFYSRGFDLALSSTKINQDYIYTFNQRDQNEEVIWVNYDGSQNLQLEQRSFCSNQKLIVETDHFIEFNQFKNIRKTYQYQAEEDHLVINYRSISHEEIINFNYLCQGKPNKVEKVDFLPSKEINHINE